MKINIRLIYLYLFSFIGLFIVVIGSVRMVDLGLKIIVFREADRFEYAVPKHTNDDNGIDEKTMKAQARIDQTRNRQREFSNALAMIAVGLPLYYYHWRTIQKEHKHT